MATTSDDVWRLLAELAEAQKETDRKFQETDRKFQETDRKFQETDRQIQATDRQIQATDRQIQATDRQIQATDRQIQETTQSIEQANRQLNQQLGALSQQLGALGGKWGQFVENLVAPACKTLFLERGIPVHQVSQRVKRFEQGETLEIDVLVQNRQHVMAVEVKSTLGVEDVQEFVEDLGRFHQFFPDQAGRQLYGAVAAITFDAGADRYAYRQGLFVLAQVGDNMTILNDAAFEPRVW
jgi:hypothetical protein